MFPTHVGIARDCNNPDELYAYVPYACGDCAAGAHVFIGRQACSLRMWGLRAGRRQDQSGHGMFPTHVGIARVRILRCALCADVPYACGDCAASAAASAARA